MPRKGKRGPDGKPTPWYSKKAEEAHSRAAAQVCAQCSVGKNASGPVYSVDALVATYFSDPCHKLRVSPDAGNGWWIKCAISTITYPRHYLLVWAAQDSGITAGIVQLCEKVQEYLNGDLKPSPDNWHG